MKNNGLQFSVITFSLTILISSFLLFQVQPLIGKYILPWFGGTSFVWITSLLFFQTMLLAGYLYSFMLSRVSLRIQFILHGMLVLISAATIYSLFAQWHSPITPGINMKLPETFSPALQVLAILTISVGLPYFLLSTTSTILQHWFSIMPHKKSPYPLYALSNVGSLLAICAYPFLIEPFFTIQNQGRVWSGIFILLCALLLFCIIQMILLLPDIKSNKKNTKEEKHSTSVINTISNKKIYLWLLYPATSSIILTAVTHQLTQGIAPIPFIWLLPLGLYLLSFILCFSEKNFYNRNIFTYVFLLCSLFIISLVITSSLISLIPELLFYTILLFSAFMICHGELFRARPHAAQLNIYYLIMSAGSVLGSIIVAIIAPLFFIGLYWEFLLGLYIVTMIAILLPIQDTHSFFSKKFVPPFISEPEKRRFFLTLVTVVYLFIASLTFITQYRNAQGVWRNFYGILRVVVNEKIQMRCLSNGKITHGCQPINTAEKMKPTMYYGEKSVGLAFSSIRNEVKKPLRIGVIGLGVGTVATYGKTGDRITFYELNPLDVAIAKNYFTYLSDTNADVSINIGDGRNALEKELQQNQKNHFTIFIMDAFNDDAIPVHLLTKEAFGLYKAHMDTKGIIAIHISNSYIDLIPVVSKAAAYHKLHVVFTDTPASNTMESRSKWAFLSEDKKLLETPEIKKVQISGSIKNIDLWTDDYSNLFQILTIR